MASVVLTFGGKEIKTYELTQSATVVGRDPGVDIVIDNLGVSRSHCQFIQRGGGFLIQDMNSANGTYVNGKGVGEHELVDNDQIVVGKYVIAFKTGAGERTPAAAAPAAPASPATAPAHDKLMPDSLNTYMMDGDKIKERLQEMKRQEDAKQAAPAAETPREEQPAPVPAPTPAPAPPAPPPVPAPAAVQPPPAASEEPGHKRHTRIVMGSSRSRDLSPDTVKRYLYFSLLLNIVLAAAFGILYLFYLQQSA